MLSFLNTLEEAPQSFHWYSWCSFGFVNTVFLHIVFCRLPCLLCKVHYQSHFPFCSSSQSKVPLWSISSLESFLYFIKDCWAQDLRNTPVHFLQHFEGLCNAKFLLLKFFRVVGQNLWFRLKFFWKSCDKIKIYPVSSFFSSFCSSERIIWILLLLSSMQMMISFLKRFSASYMSSTSTLSKVSFKF